MFNRPLFTVHTTTPSELADVLAALSLLREELISNLDELAETTNREFDGFDKRLDDRVKEINSSLTNIDKRIDELTVSFGNTTDEITKNLNEHINSNDLRIKNLSSNIAEELKRIDINIDTLTESTQLAINELNQRLTVSEQEYNTRLTNLARDIRNEIGEGTGELGNQISALNTKHDDYVLANDKKVNDLSTAHNDHVTSTTNSINEINSRINTANKNIKSNEDKIRVIERDFIGKSGGVIDDGRILFKKTLDGIYWEMNSDGAAVRFKNDSDRDITSCLEFLTRDNRDEYFRWAHYTSGANLNDITKGIEYMTLKESGLALEVGSFKGSGARLTNLPSAALTGNIPTNLLPTTATRWPTLAEVTGKPTHYPTNWGSVADKPATATRWPTLAEIGAAAATHQHHWNQLTNIPATATRWPTLAEVTGKPTHYPTTWNSVDSKPATATRWPTLAEIGAAASNHEHQHVPIPDNRGAARAPSFFPRRAVRWDFIESSNTGAGGDSWNVLMTVSPWSGYNDTHRQQQLIFTGTGGLKFRHATSDSAWGALRTILDSGNFGSVAPATATRWPTLAEVTGKPTHYPTTWNSVASKPTTATRWPTKSEIGLGNVPNVDTRNANNISSGTLNTQRIPVAPNSTSANQGFGGFRYTFTNGVLSLFTT